MKTLDDIQLLLAQNKVRLFGSYPIKSLAIFGSFARKEASQNSDIDMLVEFDDKIGLKFIDLANELENIIGLKVDLVSRKGIKTGYLNAIEPDLIYV